MPNRTCVWHTLVSRLKGRCVVRCGYFMVYIGASQAKPSAVTCQRVKTLHCLWQWSMYPAYRQQVLACVRAFDLLHRPVGHSVRNAVRGNMAVLALYVITYLNSTVQLTMSSVFIWWYITCACLVFPDANPNLRIFSTYLNNIN
jgi:hypothetical protein